MAGSEPKKPQFKIAPMRKQAPATSPSFSLGDDVNPALEAAGGDEPVGERPGSGRDKKKGG